MAVKNYLINDKWLDLDKQNIVEVKSTDGVIGSIKLNGEEYGGGGGSSDFSTANVTVDVSGITDQDYTFNIIMPMTDEHDNTINTIGQMGATSLTNGVGAFKAVVSGDGAIAFISVPKAMPPTYQVELSGQVENAMVSVEWGYKAFLITGDCTITIS